MTTDKVGQVGIGDAQVVVGDNSIIGAAGDVGKIADGLDGDAVQWIRRSPADRDSAAPDRPAGVVLDNLQMIDLGLPLEPFAHGVRVGLDFVGRVLSYTRRLVVAKLALELDEADAVALGHGITVVAGPPDLTSARLLDLSPDLAAPGDGHIAADDKLKQVGASLALELNVYRDHGAVKLAAQLALKGADADMAGRRVARFKVGGQHALNELGRGRKVESNELLREARVGREALEGLDLFGGSDK